MIEDPLETEPATADRFNAQLYVLANPDLADPVRDGLDPRAHFDAHGRAERRHQLAVGAHVSEEQRSRGVTLCAIARNERPYLLEWIAHHRLLGFEQIAIYDNESSDGSDDLLHQLEREGYITHHSWPDHPLRSAQISAYVDAVARCRTRWILFLDLDEFLHLADATIDAFLARFDETVGAVGLNWRVFGSAGLSEATAEPVIERFTRAAPRDHPLNRQIKTLAIASRIYVVKPHRVRLFHGRYVDASGAILDPGRGFAPIRHQLAQINHYAVKSRAEFIAKRLRGCVLRYPGDPAKLSHRDGSYFADHDRNEEVDNGLASRAPLIREEMARITARLATYREQPMTSSRS